MTPYDSLPRQNFWKASAQAGGALEVDFDYGRKFTFGPADRFATAGSCFAQHLARHLETRGVELLVAEARHPLVRQDSGHGYGLFSARYGNIYTVRHLRELVEQALGARPPVGEFVEAPDGRWIDMLRPRAVPMGFASAQHARADRRFHLDAVRRMLETLDVFVFTLGLTEAWENVEHGYCYPIVPGAIAGKYSSRRHRFVNYGFHETAADLRRITELLSAVNPKARVLLTVSPVGLVATAEHRSVMVSTSASKSVLRAAVDETVREHASVDYFPSYEIITGPYGRGRYWTEGCRDVTEEGVRMVMEVFAQSRLPGADPTGEPARLSDRAKGASPETELRVALDAECDELFLDPSTRRR
jgi:hypothetical protein